MNIYLNFSRTELTKTLKKTYEEGGHSRIILVRYCTNLQSMYFLLIATDKSQNYTYVSQTLHDLPPSKFADFALH